jgi:hypothetical protein
MDPVLLTQAEMVLTKCGGRRFPAGLSAVLLPKGYLMQNVLAVGADQTQVLEIDSDTTFVLRAISSTTAGALYLQIQLPDGKFLMNSLMDVNQIGAFGSFRLAFNRELACPPGSVIRVHWNDTIPGAVAVQPVTLLFEGALRYYLRSARPVPALPGPGPRYFSDPDQNILAPCWMHGQGPGEPGDLKYTYAIPQLSILGTGTNLTASGSVQIDQGTDFEARRLLFDVQQDATVTAGRFLVRLRTASGYAFCDDYLDVAAYINGTVYPHDWHIVAGEQVFLDAILVDFTGTGSMYLTAHLEGVKRSKLRLAA